MNARKSTMTTGTCQRVQFNHQVGRQVSQQTLLPRRLFCGLSVALFASMLSVGVQAQEAPLRAVRPNLIDNAVGVYITQKGEGFFSRNLEGILGNAGIDVRQGFFPELRYTSERPIPLEDLAKTSPESGALVQNVRGLLQQWFMGLVISNPRPDVTVRNGGYRVNFKRLSLSTDREALRSLGRSSGVVLVLEAEIDRLEIGGESVTVRDLQNPFFGSVGMMNPVLGLAPGSRALRLRIPIYMDVASTGLAVESLIPTTNFGETALQLTYGNLVVPNIAVEINGNRFELNKAHLTQTFEEMKPRLLEQLKGLADQIARESFSSLANDTLRTSLPATLEQASPLRPPGAPDTGVVDNFVWGLQLKKLGLGSQVLGIELAGYVEDPKSPRMELSPMAGARGPVSFAGTDPTQYDLVLTVNRGLINRILQLSFGRGYLNEVDAGPGQKLKLFVPPTIDAYLPTARRNAAEPQLKIRVGLSSPITGLKSSLFRGDVRFFVDIVGRLVRAPTGGKGLRVRLDTIDESSLSVVDDSLSALGRVFRGTVESGVKDQLRAGTAGWSTTPMILPGDLPLPPELLGQTLSIQAMRMDRNGYIVMFLNFDETANNSRASAR